MEQGVVICMCETNLSQTGTTVVGLGAQVYVLGGRKADGHSTAKIYTYDGVDKEGWSKYEVELPTPAAEICAVSAWNDRFLVVAGEQVSGSLDLTTGTWRDFLDFPSDPNSLPMPVPKVTKVWPLPL